MANGDGLKRINESTASQQAYADILGQLNEVEANYLQAYARWKDKNDYMRDNNVNKPLIDRCFAEILNIGMNSIGRYGLNAYNVTTVIGYSVILMSQGADMKKILSMKVADTFERPIARMLQRERVRAEQDPTNMRVQRKYNYLNNLHEKILNHSSETSMFYTPKSAALELTANEMHYFNAIRQPNITPADMERLKLENEQRRNSLYERLTESGVDLDELQKETIKVQRNLIHQRPAWATRFQLFDYDPNAKTLDFHNMDARFVGRTQVKKYYRYYNPETGEEVVHPTDINGLEKREVNPIDDEGIIDKTATVEYEMSNVYDIPDEMMFDENGYIDKNLIHWSRPIYSKYEYHDILKIFFDQNYDALDDPTVDVTDINEQFDYLKNCAISDGIADEDFDNIARHAVESVKSARMNGVNPEGEDEVESEGDFVDDFDGATPDVYADDNGFVPVFTPTMGGDVVEDDENITVEDVQDENVLKSIDNGMSVDMSEINEAMNMSNDVVESDMIVDDTEASQVTETTVENNSPVRFGEITAETVKERFDAKIQVALDEDENFIQKLNMTPAAFRGNLGRFEPIDEVPTLDTNEDVFNRVCMQYDELCHLRGYYPYEGRKDGMTYSKEQRQINVDQVKTCMYTNGAILSEMHKVVDDTCKWAETIEANRQTPIVSDIVAAKANEINTTYGSGSDFSRDVEFLEKTILPNYHRGNLLNNADLNKVFEFAQYIVDHNLQLNGQTRDQIYEDWVKQQTEYMTSVHTFDRAANRERIMLKAQEDVANGVPRVKVDQTVEDKAQQDENNPISGKNAVDATAAIIEDRAFDEATERLTSNAVEEAVSKVAPTITDNEQALATEFAEEVISDGMDEAVGAGMTAAVNAVKEDFGSKVQPIEGAKKTGRIRTRSQKEQDMQKEVKSVVKSKGSRRKGDVNKALEEAKKVAAKNNSGIDDDFNK